ncbi:MAG: accessory factor UbiK family protein [Cycloclasticus sp.]
MFDINAIENLAKSLSDQLPTGLTSIKDEVEKNFKSVLQQQFSKLDLVTREEFDTQSAVLTRTRDKLEELEKTILDLSTAIKDEK